MRKSLFILSLTVFALAACDKAQQPTEQPKTETAPVAQTQPQSQTETVADKTQVAYDTDFNKDFRESFVKAATQSCTDAAVKAGASETKAAALCQCAAEKSVAVLSDEDLKTIQEHRDLTPEIKAKLDKAAQNAIECRPN